MKRETILIKAKGLFGVNAPKEAPHVTLFAKRYAASHELQFPPNL
jgi:hypothetical protein